MNEFWSERGALALVAGRFPTSLVVDPVFRSWVGDPRGSWNGNVLVSR